MAYASQTWTKDLIGKTLKSAKDQGLLGGEEKDEIVVSSEEPTGDDKPKFWLDTNGTAVPTTDAEQLNVYSTEETVCGTWIDGKPIYRKVINCIYPTTSFSQIGSVSDVSTFISGRGMIVLASGNIILDGYYRGTNASFEINYSIDDSNNLIINGVRGSELAGTSCICIVEYTKTTD